MDLELIVKQEVARKAKEYTKYMGKRVPQTPVQGKRDMEAEELSEAKLTDYTPVEARDIHLRTGNKIFDNVTSRELERTT